MKAILHTEYGPPEKLQLKEVEKPIPKANEVLIKIHTTTVTTSDCNFRNLTFVPKLVAPMMKLQFGYSKPKYNIIGLDLAGEIEAVGGEVTRFKVGDKVFGTPEPALGTYAEYTCIPADGVLTIKPESMTYEEAAAITNMANTALFYTRDLGNIKEGDKVLINGASGGIGTYAVQLAKYYGAEVTGVCSTKNLELVESLGADHVIDYTKEDFTKNGETYDVIFDAVGKRTFSDCKDSLKEGGVFLHTIPELHVFLSMLWTSVAGSKKVKMAGAPAKVENLDTLKELVVAGNLKTIVGRRYPLEQIAEAFRYVEGGHKTGNAIINVIEEGE